MCSGHLGSVKRVLLLKTFKNSAQNMAAIMGNFTFPNHPKFTKESQKNGFTNVKQLSVVVHDQVGSVDVRLNLLLRSLSTVHLMDSGENLKRVDLGQTKCNHTIPLGKIPSINIFIE